MDRHRFSDPSRHFRSATELSTLTSTVPGTSSSRDGAVGVPESDRDRRDRIGRERGSERKGCDSDTDRRTILLVEDNAAHRRYVRRLLESDYRVVEAEDGREGLQKARRIRPALVVADVIMPEMDGVEMVEALRRSTRIKHIPVVMLTVCSATGDRVEGLERGADAYITKPFEPDVLTAQIGSLITSWSEMSRTFAGDHESVPHFDTRSVEGMNASFESRVREVIGDRMSNPDLTVTEVADAVGCTRRTLTRRLKKAVGQSPSAFIRTLRLEKGVDLLESSEKSVSQIAYAVGFNSLSYFSRRFKKRFGISPSEYRDKHDE